MSSSPVVVPSSSPASQPPRGVFILLEGLDRSGKSSQCVRLAETLNAEKADSAVQMRFPDRTTAIGKMIDAYLKQATEIDDHAIHLLFSANRWEKNGEMASALSRGQHLVVDRYAYSGIAFTSSKAKDVPSLSLEWTTAPDRGLLAPDLVIFLDITSEDAAKRGSFGEERYEKKEIQDRVREIFAQLREQATTTTTTSGASVDGAPASTFGAGVAWSVVNAGQTQEQVAGDILRLAKGAIQQAQGKPIRYL